MVMDGSTDDEPELLDRLREGSHDAFTQLVHRHIHWVHSVAIRRVGDPHLAQDVTQATFTVLFEKPPRLRAGQMLSAWLFTVVHHASLQALRAQSRRRHHETEAAKMKRTTGSGESATWDDLSPHLDELVNRLRAADRQAILLRFYEQMSFAHLGARLGISEPAARQRLSRAVERLRAMFARRRIVVPGVALPDALLQQATVAAPGTLVDSLTSLGAPTSLLARGVLAAIAWSRIKLAAAMVGAVVLFVGIGAAAILQLKPPEPPPPAAAGLRLAGSQLEQMIRQNSDSLARLSRLVAELEESTQLWRDGQTSRQGDRVRLIVDGNNVREERQAAPGEQPQERTMTFPMADGIAIVGPGMASRSIRTPEFRATYRPGDERMAVIPGQEQVPFGRDPPLFHRFLSLGGTPLEEKVRALIADRYEPRIRRDWIDGVECQLLEWDFPKSQMASRMWIAPGQGHLLKRVEQYLRGEVVERWTAELKAYGETFCISRVAWSQWSMGQPSRTTLLTVKALDLNPQIDPALFTLDGLGLPDGTMIQDRRGEPTVEWRYSRPAMRPAGGG